MILIKKFLFFVFLVFIFCGCDKAVENSNDVDSYTYSTITAQEAYEMMNDNVIILDVRDLFEYNTGHIVDSINIPVNSIETTVLDVISDKNKVILVYCQSGGRAKVAASKLVEIGYKNVYTFGGVNNWPYDLIVE